MKDRFIIYPSLYEDAKEGWVWLPSNVVDENVIFIEIKNPKNDKRVVCAIRRIDSNFKRKVKQRNSKLYNDINSKKRVIVINEYYRKILGITKNKEALLIIKPVSYLYGYVCSMFYHPNEYVRLTLLLSLFSVALGMISLSISIISMAIYFQ